MLKDCDKWPKQWMGIDEDLLYGQGLVEAMRPFILHLLALDVTDRTVKKHLENLWLLGDQIIRDVSLYEEYEISPADKLKGSISPDEGPLCRHITSEAEQRSFDGTCGKLCRFLENPDKIANKQIHPPVKTRRVHDR
jgi:hypothetical protein